MNENTEFKVILTASQDARYDKFRGALELSLGGWIEGQWQIERHRVGEPLPDGAQLCFIDAQEAGVEAMLEMLGERLEPTGCASFLIVEEENAELATFAVQCLNSGLVDDVLVFPFRPIEVLGKLRHYHQNLMWDEVTRLSDGYGQTLERLGADLQIAERIHRAKLPTKFPRMKGAKVAYRYLAGMKPGGEYFDLSESPDGQQVSMIFSDASSYGLSSAFLKLLVATTVRLGGDAGRGVRETFERIRGEIGLCMGEKDRLSFFYGILSRKDYVLHYLNFGSAKLLYAPAGQPFAEVSQAAPAIAAAGVDGAVTVDTQTEHRLPLEAGSRLILLSDGFWERVESLGSAWWEKNRDLDAEALTTELSFLSKKDLEGDDEMPTQDCTAVVFDVDARLIRLAG